MEYRISFEGKEWFYETYGNENGIPVFLLHGFCESHNVWNMLINHLNPSYLYIIVDLPGFGQTERIESWDFDMTANFIKYCLYQLGREKCLVIGHSMGGYVAAAFQKLHPHLLIGLGFFHSHPFPDSEEKKLGREKGIRFIHNHGTEKYVRELIVSIYSNEFKSQHIEIVEKEVADALGIPAQNIEDALNAMKNREDLSSYFAKSEAPVLHIVGKMDKTLEEKYVWKSSYLSPVNMVGLLNNSAHAGMIEETEKSAEVINHFLDYCSGV